MSSIGFIGTGHIAAPMVRFLSDRGHEVTVSNRNADVAAQLNQSHGVRVADNQSVVDTSDIVFLCVRPHIAEDVLTSIDFRPDQQIISVMAGISLKHLQAICAPATDFSLTIPFGFLEKGGCPLPAYPSKTLLEQLFSPENPVIELASESALNQHFAICTMLPGLLDLMATGAGWLGAATGDQDAAALYTTQLIRGFLDALPPASADQLARERDALATQGTISLQMTTALRDGRCHDTLEHALDAINTRLKAKS